MRLLALGALNLFLLSASEAFVSPPSYLSQSASTNTARERRKPETSSTTTVVNPSTSVSYPSNTSLQSTANWNELKQQKIRLTQQSNRNHMAQTIKACKILNFHPKMQFSKSGVVLDLDMKFVKKAYRQMALTHHPDYLLSSDATEEERQAANDRFAKINQAYTFLTSTKRYYHQDLNENGQVKVVQRDRTTQKNFGHDPSVPFLTRVNQKYQERNQKVVKGNIASEKTAASPKFVASVKKAVNPRDQHIFSEMREQDRRMVVNPTQPTQPLIPKRVLNQKIQTFEDGNDMAVEKLDDGTSSEMVGNNELNGNETPLEHSQARVEAVAEMEYELGDTEKEEAIMQIAQEPVETNINEQRDEATLQVSYNQIESMTFEENQLDEQKEKNPLQIPYSPMEHVNELENQTEIEQKEQATLLVTQTSTVSTLGDANQPGEQNEQAAMQVPPNQVGVEATANISHNQVGAEVTANFPQAGVKSIDGSNNQSSEQNEKIRMETTFVQQKEEVALENAQVKNNMNKVNDDEQKHSQSPQFPEQQLYRVVNYVEIQEPAEEEQKDE